MKMAIVLALSCAIGCGAPPIKKKAPTVECSPLEMMGSSNGYQSGIYTCVNGKFVLDKAATDKANRESAEYERAQRDLLYALGSRKLTSAELQRLDSRMNLFPMVPYFSCVEYANLFDLLVTQYELQTGNKLAIHLSLSKALGEFNRCPQEHDNERAVEELIETLQTMKH